MNKNFALKFKIADIFVIIFSFILSIAIMLGGFILNNSFSDKRIVHIYHQNVLLENYLIDLNTLDTSLIVTLKKDEFPSLSGDFKIEMNKEKGVRVYRDDHYRVDCENHDCEKMGWVNMFNFPLVCLPNDVIVVIKGSNQNGDITLGGIVYEKFYF
jgi:hypothetical protein